jgi:hypothetical protein
MVLMESKRPRACRLLLAATAIALAVGQHRALAQFEDDAEDQPAPAHDARLDPLGRQVLIVNHLRELVKAPWRAQIEQFRARELEVGSAGPPRIERLLAERIAELKKECALSGAQLRKIQIAGMGDIKHFQDRLAVLSRKLDDPAVGLEDLQPMLTLEWHRFQSVWNGGIFGDGSLLEKTLTATLEPEQVARRRTAQRDQPWQRYAAAVALAVARLRRDLDLSVPQVQQLTRLILAETRPPTRFGRRSEIALVLFQISKLPEDALRPTFDATQWSSLQKLLEDYKPGSAAQATLERNGFVFENDSSTTQPALAAKTAPPAPAAVGKKE